MICLVPGCKKPRERLGWCTSHYCRWRRHGDPQKGRTPQGAAMEWLIATSTLKSSVCLEWPFRKDHSGYGMISKEGGTTGAHRMMCLLAHGQPPTAIHHAAHSCNNPSCVNPSHLRWATPSENQQDRIAHGTYQCGEQIAGSRLSPADVLAIRAAVGSQMQIAQRFGIGRSTVRAVLSGRTWKHITEANNNG